MKNTSKILFVATSKNTRGGITSVITLYEHSALWKNWDCYWIESHVDKTLIKKLLYFIRSLTIFVYKLPSAKIIHLHLSQPMSAIRKSTFFMLSRLFRKKIIIHFHSFDHKTTIQGSFRKLYQYMFSRADVVIVLSDQWKKWINDSLVINNDKIKVVFNPCPNPHLVHREQERFILYAGTLNKRKGYHDLIKAFSKVSENFPLWKLVFAGNGEIDEAKILVKKEHNKNIEFAGWVTGSQKNALFQKASIFCLPSYAEGFPMAVLDAWAYGLPVITTPVGGLSDILINGKNALVFNAGDIENLSEHLTLLMGSEEFQKRLSIESLNLSKEKFNIRNITSEVDIIYNNLLRG